jgi:hypothetical protein
MGGGQLRPDIRVIICSRSVTAPASTGQSLARRKAVLQLHYATEYHHNYHNYPTQILITPHGTSYVLGTVPESDTNQQDLASSRIINITVF